jgi:hypothetical protein
LLNKLEKVTNDNLKWFQSCFSERQIAVRNGEITSSHLPLKEGTPQGSSLSGLLFSIYINEVPDIFQNCQVMDFTGNDLELHLRFP